MCASHFLERLLSWLESQMVCVVETEVASRLSQLFGREALERGLSCDWHEHREQHGAMGELEDRSAGFGGLLLKCR